MNLQYLSSLRIC